MRRVCLVILCTTAQAHADATVTVTLNQQGQDLANQIGASVQDLVGNAQQKIDGLFQLSGLPHLLQSLANTGAFANRGLGVEYQPDDGDVMFGVVADGAIAGDTGLSSDHVLSATILNYAVTAGVNLGRWQHPRWTVFANGSYAATTIRGLSGDLIAGGAHVQYQAIPASAPATVRWTGLAVTTGLEYARWAIGLSSSLETHITVTGTTDQATVHMSSTGTLSVLAETTTLPLEVTTGVRFFDLLGIYGGGGLDLTTGSSTITAMLDSQLTIDADNLPIGTATITASGANGPSSATVHALAGVELHTRHVRVFVQGEIAPDERNVALGFRIVP